MNWYYYHPKDGPADKIICQYMRLDYLLQLLETHKLYAKRRRENDDANEGYYKKYLESGFSIANNGVVPQTEDLKRNLSYKDIVDCPISCWTKTERESYLMWKGYAGETGVRIKSSIHNLVASLQLDLGKEGADKVYCGSMIYCRNYLPSNDEEKQFFSKQEFYTEEDEFRFYFILSDDSDKKYTTNRLISVDPYVMIDEILFSPFLCKEAAKKLVRMIKCCYGIENVRQSEIKIKK